MSRINNYNSLYNIDQKPEPFIETGAYTAIFNKEIKKLYDNGTINPEQYRKYIE